jgi:uncharacterized protein YegL
MGLSTNMHAPRVLPVIILADVSGSMTEHAKIESLNLALREMLRALSGTTEPDVEVKIAVISFGGSGARLHLQLSAPDANAWQDLAASGGTPLGSALDELVKLAADRTVLPENSYQPTVVLVSDGIPTDDFEAALTRLERSPIGTRAVRIAVRIGPDANVAILERFTGDSLAVLSAADAADIDKHFRFITYTVMSRAKSTTGLTTDMPTLRQFGSSSGPLF